jgi:hypothetical protein
VKYMQTVRTTLTLLINTEPGLEVVQFQKWTDPVQPAGVAIAGEATGSVTGGSMEIGALISP